MGKKALVLNIGTFLICNRNRVQGEPCEVQYRY